MDQDSVHMVVTSKVPMLKPCEYKLWRMRMEQYIQMIVYSLWEVIENGNAPPVTKIIEGVETTIAPSTTKEKEQRRLEPQVRSTLSMGIPNEHQLMFNSIKDSKSLLHAIEKRFKNITASSSEVLDQTFNRLQKLISQLEIHGESISQEDVNQKFLRSLSPEWNTHTIVWRNKPEIKFDKSKVECYNCHKKGHFARECRAPRNQENRNREITRRVMPVETTTSNALISCDGLGDYDWSDQSEEGPTNFALMAYSSISSNSKVSTDSNCLESAEARLLVYKKNESVYVEDIKLLKRKIYLKEVAITELRRKLELAQKQKDEIQLTVEKLENSSKSLSKLIDCQIVDKCKTDLGYHAVLPPYTGNFMPLKPDLSFSSLEEFVNEPIVSDSEEEDVTQAKVEKKTVKLSFAKIKFVKSKEQVKTPSKTTVKQGSNFEMINKLRLLYVCGVVDLSAGNMSSLLTLKKLMEDMLPLEVTPKEGKSQAELTDESHVLLKVPRKNNMYSVDLKNIVPKGGLTCLFAKATFNESKLWHRRLGHINFKTMNKLVKGNLVRGLPSKLFENDQTCVACQKRTQHRASSDLNRIGVNAGDSKLMLLGINLLLLGKVNVARHKLTAARES
ncbi:putative ribonuclease H-like domain-containing protein [Tanacetum coccineum]|uniref:Ribonuclease H-like domain-containing protein n=1 Tax=Tanacetum coccineum TaxID=301880 RepID=A0ABQ4ZGM8_9ASTR